MKNDIDSADRPAEKNEGVPPAVMREALHMLRFHVAEDRLINVDQEGLLRDLYLVMTATKSS